MKNKILAVAAIVLAAASCEMEPAAVEYAAGDAKLIRMELCAAHETTDPESADSETKATIELDNTVLWSPNDSISIFPLGDDPCEGFKFKSTDTSSFASSALFVGQCTASEKGYLALYPFQKDNYDLGWTDSDYDGVADCFKVGWNGFYQEAVLGGVNPHYAIMAGYAPYKTLNEDTKVNFKHLFSFVKITTTFPCDEINICGNNDEPLNCSELSLSWNGNAAPSSSDDVPSIAITKSSSQNSDGSVTLKKRDTLRINPGTYYIAVIPQTLESGFTLTFKNVDGFEGKLMTKKTAKAVTFSRAHILNLGAISTDDFRETGSTLSGSGTSTDPYLISSLEQFKTFAEKVNGKEYSTYSDKYYLLTDNIDCDGKSLPCVGLDKNHPFKGTFNGNNHTISNFKISQAVGSSAIFAYTRNVTVRNLNVQPCDLEYTEADNISSHALSPLVGVSYTDAGNWTTIENCHALKSDTYKDLLFSGGANDVFAGGMVGVSYGQIKITDCSCSLTFWCMHYGYVSFSGVYSFGGILGEMYNYATDELCIIDRCRFNGDYIHVMGYCDINIGGILGKDGDGWTIDEAVRITNCAVSGSLQANELVKSDKGYKDANVGGIIGYHNSDGDTDLGDPLIYNCCVHAGLITGFNWRSRVGGIMGYCADDDTKVYNCAVSASMYAAGEHQNGGALCGWDYGDYYHCHWNIYSYSETYGIVANNWFGYLHSTDCSAVESISAETMNSTSIYLPDSDIPAEDSIPFSACKWKDGWFDLDL